LAPTSRRSLATLIALCVATGLIFALRDLGGFLAREEPLQHGDALFVLAGTRLERPLEAADLFVAGYAPRIVMTHQKPEPAFAEAERRGVHLPLDAEIARDVLVGLGVPRSAITIPTTIHDNTAQEARTLRTLAVEGRWRRVLVVTSGYHLRRAALAIRRELAGTGVEVVMRRTRHDDEDPKHWWRHRSDLRAVWAEAPKILAYACGLGAG
jgi:uncharacterized SAM-binding protein YcdF (DUF218 family)